MSIFTQLRNSSPTTTIQDLTRENERLERLLRETKRQLAMTKSKLALFERNRQLVTPIGDMEEGYECGNCGEPVSESVNVYCPRCGAEQNWDWSMPVDENAFDRRFDR